MAEKEKDAAEKKKIDEMSHAAIITELREYRYADGSKIAEIEFESLEVDLEAAKERLEIVRGLAKPLVTPEQEERTTDLRDRVNSARQSVAIQWFRYNKAQGGVVGERTIGQELIGKLEELFRSALANEGLSQTEVQEQLDSVNLDDLAADSQQLISGLSAKRFEEWFGEPAEALSEADKLEIVQSNYDWLVEHNSELTETQEGRNRTWATAQTNVGITVAAAAPTGAEVTLPVFDDATQEVNDFIQQLWDNSDGRYPVSSFFDVLRASGLRADQQELLRKAWVVDGQLRPDMGLSGDGVGDGRGDGFIGVSKIPTNLMSEYQRLQTQIAQGQLNLAEANAEWKRTTDTWEKERKQRIDKQSAEEFQRSKFESDRTAGLTVARDLLSGRLRAAEVENQSFLAALPYLAPKSEYLPGQEPGGVMERLSALGGATFTPVRTEDVTVPFNPRRAAQQALTAYESQTKGLDLAELLRTKMTQGADA